MTARPPEELDLLDWKRRVSAVYAETRDAEDHELGWRRWRMARDELLAGHPQSPLPEAERSRFAGLPYFDYDPAYRAVGAVQAAHPQVYEIATSGEHEGFYRFTRFATTTFELRGRSLSLELYWLEGYGGGLFVPFRDATSGKRTYGAGRYLLDTVKGADLGMDGDRLVLDFNFSYNPSCAYDPRWVCPLVPAPNRLDVAIEAGERYGST